MPVAPFVATGTACGRLRSPACAQRSLLPQAPILLPTRFMQEDGLPGITPGSHPCRSPGKMAQTDMTLRQRKPQAIAKKRKALCPPLFYAGHPFKRTLRTHSTPYSPRTRKGRHNAFLFLSFRSTSRCPLPAVQRRGPAALPEKSFLEGGAGENLLSTKGFPRSNLPPCHQLIAVQRRCCPCRSCRHAG